MQIINARLQGKWLKITYITYIKITGKLTEVEFDKLNDYFINVENKIPTSATLIDFRKAFDCLT